MGIRFPNIALFKRTLLMDNRSWRTYLGRLSLLCVILLALLVIEEQGRYSIFAGAPGLLFLQVLSVVNLVAISLLGIVAFAPTITEEKEDGTLSLLLMAGIGPLSAILSKGGGKFLAGVAFVAAQVPFTFLAVTLGGVSATHIAASYVVLFSYMFAIAGFAVLMSTLFPKSSIAGGICFFAIAVFNLSVPYVPSLAWLSPFVRISEIFTTGFQGAVFASQAAVYAGIGTICAVAAVLLFNVFSRVSGGGVSFRLVAGRGGKSEKRRAGISRSLAPGRVWRNALAWKAFHFDSGGWLGWFATLVVFSALLAFIVYEIPRGGSSRSLLEYVAVVALPLGMSALFLAGVHVSGSIFRCEINGGALPLLLILPKTLGSMTLSKVLGSSLTVVPMALLFIAFGICFSPDVKFSDISYSSMFGFCLSLACVFFYYYLTAYLSLKVRYGAFLIAGFVLMFIHICQGLVMAIILFSLTFSSGTQSSSTMLTFQYVQEGVMGVSYFLMTVALHFLVRRGVKKLAAAS